MAGPSFPPVKLGGGNVAGAPSSSAAAKPIAQLPLETFLAEWAAAAFDTAHCRPLAEEHPLTYARSKMLGLAAALRKAGYAK